MSSNEISSLLASFLRHVSLNAASHWFLVLENDVQSKSNSEKELMSEEDLAKYKSNLKDIEIMNDSSLRKYLGIDKDRYISMLLECKLVRKKAGKIIFVIDAWKQFIILHNIDAEIEKSSPLRTPTAGYIRIGKKGDSYHTAVPMQVRYCVFAPPRCNGINTIRRALTEGLYRLMPSQDDLVGQETTSPTAARNERLSSSQSNSIRANNNSSNKNNDNDAAAVKFPVLKSLGVDVDKFDLSKKKDAGKLKRLIGELITLQQAHSRDKDIIEFHRPAQSRLDTAVVIRSHKSNAAFESFHRSSPYLDKVIRCMDSDKDVAVRRLALHLAKKHESNFISAAKEAGLAAFGIMNEIDCGAMISEAGLLDGQFKIVMKHLRHNFNAKIAVPFKRVKSECCQGWTVPQVKVHEHRRDGCETEIVVAEYQNVAEEFKLAVERLLIEHGIKSRSKIKKIKLIIGGDHGQGAFRLCILVLIELEDDEEPIDTAVSIGKVFCTKEEGHLLDATIMDWLTVDLQVINDSLLLLEKSDDGRCITRYHHYSEPELDYEALDIIPIPTEQFLAGDCSYLSYSNGKENMSNHWCIYCPLKRSQFSGNHPIVNWTIATLTAMADDATKKGAERLGVTGRPYFPWIPIMHRILPVLHLLLGIGNDIITYFGHVVEWTLIQIPDEERQWKTEAVTLKDSIVTYQAKCAEWNDAPWNGTTKQKRRSALMSLKKSRAPTAHGGNRLSPEEMGEFTTLDNEFKQTRKERDDAQAKRRNLLKQINAAAKSRRTPPKNVTETWYLLMEKIYRNHNVVREDYHKKMFAGGPMRDIMKNAEPIFNEAKIMLRRFKDPTDAGIDTKIDNHCDVVIDLLRTWDRFFSILHRKSPTENDFNELDEVAAIAEQKHRVVRTVVDNSDDVPKPHTAGRHAGEQFRLHKGSLRKMYEQFVEHNHQIEMRIEAKFKRIPDHVKRANACSQKRALDSNLEVISKVRKVGEASSRGPYKKS